MRTWRPQWLHIPIRGKDMKGEISGYVCAATRRHQLYLAVVLSGTLVVRILCVCVATSFCRAVNVGVGDATEYVRWRPSSPGSASTKRFLYIIMHMRRHCAKSVSESNCDLNRM